MQLRDSVQLWGPTGESPGVDPGNNPLPPPMGLIVTVPAHVYYATAGVDFNNNRLAAVETLRAIIPDPGFDLDALEHWVVWREVEYRLDGVLDRSARGKTHHLTLELSRRQ